MFFSGHIMRPFLGLTLFAWSGINVANWGTAILDENPSAPGLALLAPVFEWVKVNIVNFIKAKSYVEVSICVVSSAGWLFALNPPFFAIVAMQFLRLKYTTSYYTRYVFDKLNRSAERLLPSFVYPYTFGMVESWVSSTVRKTDASKEDDDDEDDNKPEEGEDEPKIYEVKDDDLD